MGENERRGARQYRDALGDECLEQIGGHMLVVEGERVRPGRDPSQGVQIGMAADHDVGTDLGSRVAGIGREYPQALAQRNRGLMRHPGQLPTAHHRYLRHGPHAATTAVFPR